MGLVSRKAKDTHKREGEATASSNKARKTFTSGTADGATAEEPTRGKFCHTV